MFLGPSECMKPTHLYTVNMEVSAVCGELGELCSLLPALPAMKA